VPSSAKSSDSGIYHFLVQWGESLLLSAKNVGFKDSRCQGVKGRALGCQLFALSGPPAKSQRLSAYSLNPRTLESFLKEVVMFELFKKSMLTGVGLALKTWDEVEALGKELEEKGKMPREDAKKFIVELQQRYEETQIKLEERVEKSVRDFLKRADIVTGEDLKALKKEIRELKTLISNETTETGK